MVLRGSPAITGENISLTLPLFTKFVNMDQFHSGPIIGKTHVNPADAPLFSVTWPISWKSFPTEVPHLINNRKDVSRRYV